jgi:hypothetical protein
VQLPRGARGIFVESEISIPFFKEKSSKVPTASLMSAGIMTQNATTGAMPQSRDVQIEGAHAMRGAARSPRATKPASLYSTTIVQRS